MTAPAAQLALQLDSPLVGRVKNDRTMMVWNFFSLSTKRQQELPAYDDGQVRIEVRGTSSGVATIWDKELLIYLASLLQDKLNRNEPVARRLTFTANDFFRACCASSGGSAYGRLEEALQRLQGTQIKTNIETGGTGEDSAFSWVTDYKMQYRRDHKGEKRLVGVTVELCDWLYRAVVKDRRMLTYDLGYFKLGPLEKRLYEIARAHCGMQAGFRMGIEKLHHRVGADTPLKTFKKHVAAIIKSESTSLPSYGLIIIDPCQLGKNDTPLTPLPLKRTALKRLQVYFFPLDGIMAPVMSAPLVEDDV
jgi:plasmid replication initiation protein